MAAGRRRAGRVARGRRGHAEAGQLGGEPAQVRVVVARAARRHALERDLDLVAASGERAQQRLEVAREARVRHPEENPHDRPGYTTSSAATSERLKNHRPQEPMTAIVTKQDT